MTLTWCQLGASLCLIGASAWGMTEVVRERQAERPIEVAGPSVPPEDVADMVRWARERAGLDEVKPAAAAVVRARPFAPLPGRTSVPVPANTSKGGGKVSYVGTTSSSGQRSVYRRTRSDFTRALGKSFKRTVNWTPRFSGSYRSTSTANRSRGRGRH